MNIVISDLKDALVNSGIKNKMLAKGNSLAIKLNDSNVCIIKLNRNKYDETQSFEYTIQVYQTGNTLEENYICIPNFLPIKVSDYDKEYNRGINGKNGCYGYVENTGTCCYSPDWIDIYESKNLLELIPGVIEDLVEVINFYNGD